MSRGANSYVKKKLSMYLKSLKYCYYCQSYCDRPHIEHIHPISKGGTSDEPNLTTSCGRCNSLKGVFSTSELLDRVKEKRDKILNEQYKFTWKIRNARARRQSVVLLLINQLGPKIRQNRKNHTYFTAIINSIENGKHKIYYNGVSK